MGKKKGGKSKGYESKGERPNVSKWCTKTMRREYMQDNLSRTLNQIDAWLKGKNVMVKVANNGADAKKHPFIRVPANQVWGNPTAKYSIKSSD
jgi:hypothetical protein